MGEPDRPFWLGIVLDVLAVLVLAAILVGVVIVVSQLVLL